MPLIFADLICVNLRDLREFFNIHFDLGITIHFFTGIFLYQRLGKVVNPDNIVFSKQY
jgi:hypothetical protein